MIKFALSFKKLIEFFRCFVVLVFDGFYVLFFVHLGYFFNCHKKIPAWFESKLSTLGRTCFRNTGLKGHFYSSNPATILDITSKISPNKQSSSLHILSVGERSSRQLFSLTTVSDKNSAPGLL